MPAVNMLTYMQSLLDPARFQNNPLAGYRAPAAPLAPELQAAITRMLHEPGAQQAPPGLPDAVMRSIQQQPSFGEGQIDRLRRVPGQLPFDTQMNREFFLGDSSRTGGDRLYNELGSWRDFLKLDQPLPEGMRPYTDQFRGQPVYPSPLNQFMGRLPGMGLY